MIHLPFRFRSATDFLPKSISSDTASSTAVRDTLTHRRHTLINWTLGLLCVGWAGLLAGCSNSSTTSILGDWTKKSELEGVARYAATSFVIGNIAYMGTGADVSNNRLTDFWAYDPAKNAWTQQANFGGVGRFSAVGFSVGTKGYIGTGVDASSNRLKDFWEYDQATNKWKQVADFGGTARQEAVAFTIGNKGYVGTGFDSNYLKDMWSFDPTKNTWTKVASYGGAKRRGAISFVINGMAYVGTGNNNNANQRDWYVYDATQDLWTQKADFTTDQAALARSYAVGFAIGSKGYITLGTLDGGANSKTVWQYDPTTDIWSTLGDFEGATRTYAVGFAINGKGYVTTGGSGSGRYDDLLDFDPLKEQDLNN